MLKSKPITPDIKQERLVQVISVSRKRVLFTREIHSILINYGKILIINTILELDFYLDKIKLRATHRRIFRFCNQLRLTVTLSIILRRSIKSKLNTIGNNQGKRLVQVTSVSRKRVSLNEGDHFWCRERPSLYKRVERPPPLPGGGVLSSHYRICQTNC